MKKKLVFATNNANKVAEIRNVIGDKLEIVTLKEAGIDIDIPEPHDTLEANATEKSTTIQRLVQQDCFSEDTGLEVAVLNGEPGVKSARYAGEGRDFNENVVKLLRNLQQHTNRQARFRTVISLLWEGKEYFFEGICTGHITDTPRGSEGFGYDPVFVPDGSDRTFAEMSMDEKKQFSHRAKAMKQLVAFLTQQQA